MTTERSDNVLFQHINASEKFDYFVTGITGALCAYISQTFIPTKISFSPGTLELLALLLLILSAICGFKRIEGGIQVYKHNARTLRLKEERGELMSKSKGGTMLNQATGEVLSHELVIERINYLNQAIPESKSLTEKLANKAGDWYQIRNYLLVSGFVALVAAKIWSAYV